MPGGLPNMPAAARGVVAPAAERASPAAPAAAAAACAADCSHWRCASAAAAASAASCRCRHLAAASLAASHSEASVWKVRKRAVRGASGTQYSGYQATANLRAARGGGLGPVRQQERADVGGAQSTCSLREAMRSKGRARARHCQPWGAVSACATTAWQLGFSQGLTRRRDAGRRCGSP